MEAVGEIYCDNNPCETEATHYYVTSKGMRFHLCRTCMEAFELGQGNPDKFIYEVGQEPDGYDEVDDDLTLADYDEEDALEE